MTDIDVQKAVEEIASRAKMYATLEAWVVRLIEIAKAENLIHYAPFKTDLGEVLGHLEEFLERRGYNFCSHCGCISKRWANDPCPCEEEE